MIVGEARRRVRALLAAGLIGALPLTVAVSALIWAADLPSVLPLRWSGVDVVAVVSTPVLLVAVIALGLTGTVIAITNCRRAWRGDHSQSYLGASMTAAISASAWVALAGAAATTPDGSSPQIGLWWFVVIAAIAYAFLPPTVCPAHGPVPAAASPLHIRPDDALAWTSQVSLPVVRWAVLIVLAIVVPVSVSDLLLGTNPTASLIWLLAGVLLAVPAGVLFTRIRIMVDRRGLTIRSHVGGISLKHIPLSIVQSARAGWSEPARCGGVGYRAGSSGSGLITGPGPVLTVAISDGSEFSVSVRDSADAADAASVLEALRSAH